MYKSPILALMGQWVINRACLEMQFGPDQPPKDPLEEEEWPADLGGGGEHPLGRAPGRGGRRQSIIVLMTG